MPGADKDRAAGKRDRVDWQRDRFGLLAGFVLATLTTPVGVSGAVFLLPVQLSVLGVPSPQITPTNLIFNVIAAPGALARFGRRRQLDHPLTIQLVAGSAPGVVLGAVIRVYLVPDADLFRLIAAAVLGSVGIFILGRTRTTSPAAPRRRPSPRTVLALAFGVGILGGISGIGGGSVLGPLLVGSGMAVSRVAPAALASTWVTSMVGVVTYAILATAAPGAVAPDWSLGVSCGLGGLIGGWVGASLQPRLPERTLRTMLGLAAVALATVYVVQVLA